MSVLLQAAELGEAAKQGLNATKELNPEMQVLLISLVLIIAFLIYGIIYLFKTKIKDFDTEKKNIKKKDEQIESKTADFIELVRQNIETTSRFEQSVNKLTQTLMIIDERNKNDKSEILKIIKDDHEDLKQKVYRIKENLYKK